MKKEEEIQQMINEAMNSLNNIQRASPAPYLQTRVLQRLNKTRETLWEKAVWFIGRPAIAVPAMLLLIVVNVVAVLVNDGAAISAVTEHNITGSNDEFSFSVATIYDIENQEP